MTEAFYADPIWTCGICGNKGPWMLTLRWFDASGCYWVPGGLCQWQPEQARVATACSMECGRKFAQAVGPYRISIRRPQFEDRQCEESIAWAKRQRQGERRRAA